MPSLDIRVSGAGDHALRAGLVTMFGEAFEDPETYMGDRPGPEHVGRLLSERGFFALAAMAEGAVIGGVPAYEPAKFKRERSELYICDLAVSAPFRRTGVAPALIRHLCGIAVDRRAHVVFVQAHREDDAAIALYSRLGTREHVLHFDIAPR